MLLWVVFFGGPLKHLSQKRRFQVADGANFQEENSKLYSGIFKGLSPSTAPFGKRKVSC
jgi:hypothetical protein